jgi:hypothetical protein
MLTMIRDAKQTARCLGAAGFVGGLAVHGRHPQPTAGQHLSCWAARQVREPRVLTEGGPPPRGCPGDCRAELRIRTRGSKRFRTTRIVFSSGAQSHGRAANAKSAWLGALDPLPDRVNQSVPAAVNAATAIAIRHLSE